MNLIEVILFYQEMASTKNMNHANIWLNSIGIDPSVVELIQDCVSASGHFVDAEGKEIQFNSRRKNKSS
jgi:hypothetical protein